MQENVLITVAIVLAVVGCIMLFVGYIIKGDRAYRRKLAAYQRTQSRQAQLSTQRPALPTGLYYQPTTPRAALPTLDVFLELTPTQFERAVGGLFERLGYTHVRHTGGGGDLMADLTCVTPDGRAAVVQCKQYRPGHAIGSPAIQTFIGMVYRHHRVPRAIFVTTSTFTAPARSLAQQHNIEPIDGQQLVQLVNDAAGDDDR